jgi:uncharacterized membrane protein YbhN (UPF0104 family)
MDGARKWGKAVVRYALALAFLAVVYHLAGGLRLQAPENLGWLVAAGIAFLSIPALEATTWWVYLAGTGPRPSWPRTLRATLAAGFTAQFLPSPAPSLTRPLYLRDQVTVERGLGTTIVDRLNTLLLYGIVLVSAGAILGRAFDDASFLWLAVLAIAPLGLFAAGTWGLATRQERTVRGSWIETLLARVGGIGDLAEGADETLDVSTRLFGIGRVYRRGLVVQALAVGVGRGVTVGCLAVAMGASEHLGSLVLVVLASLALALVPVLPQGLGAVEGFGTYVLSMAGMPPDQAFTFMLAWRGLVQGLTLVLGGFAFFDAGVDLWRGLRESWGPETPRG